MRALILAAVVLSTAPLLAQTCQLSPDYSGITGVSLDQVLAATPVAGAEQYTFEVTTADGHFVHTVNSPDNSFSLSEAGLTGELVRNVSVRVRATVGGSTDAYGSAVTFTTAGSQVHPCSGISDIAESINTGDLDRQYREWREEQLQQSMPQMESMMGGGGGGGCMASYRISVVFHVVHDPGVPLSNIPDAVLLDQLAILNNEFNGPNANTLGGNACIEFCLAQNTPNGEDWLADFNSPTPGITRWADPVATYHGDGNAAMTQLANVVMFPTDIYLNIWITSTVKDGPLGVVGYATFPGSGLPLDGVVMENAFVAGYAGIPEYMEGFVAVHEVGHYLSLLHPFEGGCLGGDFCNDTPPVDQANIAGCTDLTPNSCGVPEQLENYMDYTFEFCKSTFTAEQIARMHATLLTFRSDLVDPANHVLTGIAGPNGCTDPTLVATIVPSGTQFCTNQTVGQFDGVLAVDEYHWTFANPWGGAIPPVDYNVPGVPMVPATGSMTFPTAGPWTITLTATNTVTLPLGSTSATYIVYASDCGPVLLDQAQWYFGDFCAIDFSSGAAVPIGGSAMLSGEGCASTCDPLSGTLQFYASNDRVFNSVHLPQAPQLNGGVQTSSSQGALIVPDQTNPDLYYLFTTREISGGTVPAELHFSQVDMSLNAGTGGLVGPMTNVSVGVTEPMTTEHLAAVPHCNGVDHWIVTHGFDPATFDQLISYRLTAGGVVTPPVLSPAFAVIPLPAGWMNNNNGLGQIEFNHEGDLAAITSMTPPGSCQLYSFDRENGTFELILNLPANTTIGYGLSFSRTGDFLYTATGAGIWQHDLRNLDPCNPVVPNNFTPFPTSVFVPSLQLGPDNKIYMTNAFTDFVSVINYPEIWNATVNAFGFNWQGVNIEIPGNGVNERCRIGLPNMIDAMPAPVVIDFTWCSVDCQNVNFELVGCGAVVEWDVDCDGSIDGTGNTLAWTFPGPGTYCVSLNVDGQTVVHNVDILVPPAPDIEPDVVCLGGPVVFSTTNTAGLDHQWSITGAGTIIGTNTDETVTIQWTGAGTITLVVTDPNTECTSTATMNVNPQSFSPDLGPDLTVCPGEDVTLTDLNGSVSCAWTPTTFLDLSNPCAPVFSAPMGAYTYSMDGMDANGCVGTDEVNILVNDANCEPFTITKSVNTTNTYAGAPVLYTIIVCNNTTTTQDAVLTDTGIAPFFQATSSTPTWPGFPAAPLTISVPAGGCVTIDIAGHFLAMGAYTNCVEAVPQFEDPVSACAELVNVWQNCPLAVSGTGDCASNSLVNMCMSVHSLITGLGVIDFDWVYPDFLTPPTQATLMSVLAPSSPTVHLFDATPGVCTITAPTPFNADNDVVHVHLVYQDPLGISTAGVSRLFCMPFQITGAPDPGISVYSTYVVGQGGVLNRTDLYAPDGVTEIHPGAGFWTQAANIILTGCTGIPVLDASFTVEVPACGGAVTVHGNLSDPNAIHMWTWGDDRTTPMNGAQDYTYDYFAEITENTGWNFPGTIPGAPPGTYTITHTVILNGVASISTQTITIYECCSAALVIEDGTLSSSIGSSTGGTVDVRGQFIIDQDFMFIGADVKMEPGAEIIVQSGATFDINGTSIESCQDVMWRSITANSGAMVFIQNSFIDDAENALIGLDGAILVANNTQFHNNRVAVQIPQVGGVPWNNVPFIASGNMFYSAGPMAQPYPGQTTVVGQQGYAAIEVANTDLSFTIPGNVIHSLSNGIVGRRSNMSVTGCTMMHIQPDPAYTSPSNGSGIYARGGHGFFTLKQAGFGPGGSVNFNNCRWGIYTERMNVHSVDNRMVQVGTAYHVENSGYMDIDIRNNRLDTKFDGIQLYMNDGCAHMLVQNNDITFATNPPFGQFVKGYTAIVVKEANTANPNSVIQNNTIRYRPGATTAHGGIKLLSANDFSVLTNTLIMDNNAYNYAGIYMSGCSRPLVSCNDVQGSFSNYGLNDGQSAIRNNMGDRPTIYCNNVDGTINGIYFSGPAYGTDLAGNNMNTHRWSLHLDNTAIIEQQDWKGNLWHANTYATPVDAWYENFLHALLYPFVVDPATIGTGNTMPATIVPSNWFLAAAGTNYQCDDGVTDYCSQFVREHCEHCKTELDERIAGDDLENNPYTEETQWIMKGNLFEKVDNAPEMMESDEDLAAFHAEMQNSTIGQFKLINDDYLVLYDLDPSVRDYLLANRAQMEALMAELDEVMAQLGDADTAPEERAALLATLGGLRQSLNELATLNNQALEQAASDKSLTADAVKAANEAIGTSELIEANEKRVKEIYLSTLAKDIDGFSTDEAAQLFDIANQCPMVGGNAVYRARSLYALIDDELEFDDPTLCLAHGILVRSMEQPATRAVQVMPNPAADEAVLVYQLAEGATGTLLIHDAVGKEVLRLPLSDAVQRFYFSTAALAPGAYHYLVLEGQTPMGEGKLTIVR